MSAAPKHFLLADDDEDDRLLFQYAVENIKLPVQITTASDGEQLMKYLSQAKNKLPDALFLDLNMPRKNGFTCLKEIKSSKSLSDIPVIIFSTSYEPRFAELLYEQGAHYYIAKPAGFDGLKEVIHRIFTILKKTKIRPPKKDFLIKNPE